MKTMRFLFAVPCLLGLVGCAATGVPAPPQDPAGIKVFTPDQAKGREFEVLGKVIGKSCSANAAVKASQDEAIVKMKQQAVGMGADAVIAEVCEDLGRTAADCLQTVICRGTAVRKR